ncbi:cyanoexosortase A system-associated protein [Nostoc sphaeroides]|uniref:Cyanoexosortase A system-associated protein n=1 Tax=Nostoc sphaeroides CCNUC1 TaxID=2653204 RepID=A0A5P8VW62_9NOSO|nr:cyanoexosortase A system-associated protein [Nostoc sphaeroides]QFS44591.1 cyanoexosortase A system-associated protein [Nostoc sphaeroides CCNUC1]
MYWKQTRIKFLALIFTTGMLVLGKTILFPNPDKPKINTFVFPKEVPLVKWQLSVSSPIKSLTKENPNLVAERHYKYVKNNLPLDIEMLYLQNLYNVDIGAYIQQYYPDASTAVMRQQKGVGYYGVGIDRQKAYLSSCINPRGNSTFTHTQFRENRYFQDISFDRIMPILRGQEALLDKRCLWVHLSIPLRNSSPEASYQLLEQAWFSWYKWWQTRFPKP